jgi:hypothetical protein
MAALKMRSIESPLFLDSYKALGVDAVSIAWPETFTALQQKVVDGADLPYNTMALSKWLEVQQYVTLSGWVYEPMPAGSPSRATVNSPPMVSPVSMTASTSSSIFLVASGSGQNMLDSSLRLRSKGPS